MGLVALGGAATPTSFAMVLDRCGRKSWTNTQATSSAGLGDSLLDVAVSTDELANGRRDDILSDGRTDVFVPTSRSISPCRAPDHEVWKVLVLVLGLTVMGHE